jgi:hypothetical protein
MHTPDLSGQSPSRSDEVALRLDDENIYFSQRAGAFEELCLGETLEAAHLRKLLRDAGGDGSQFCSDRLHDRRKRSLIRMELEIQRKATAARLGRRKMIPLQSQLISRALL